MYASAAAKNVTTTKAIFSTTFSTLPQPLTISIKLESGCTTTPKDLHDSLISQFNVHPLSMHKVSISELQITLSSRSEKRRLLQNSFFTTSDNSTHTIFDQSSNTITINVLGVPYQLSNAAVRNKLTKYGRVQNIRRGYYRDMPEVENGVRHVQMEMLSPVPSYIQFGSKSFQARYNGQALTCRKCDKTGHHASACGTPRCFNCGVVGHIRSECPSETLCCLCLSDEHDPQCCPEWHVPESQETDSIPVLLSPPIPVPTVPSAPSTLDPPVLPSAPIADITASAPPLSLSIAAPPAPQPQNLSFSNPSPAIIPTPPSTFSFGSSASQSLFSTPQPLMSLNPFKAFTEDSPLAHLLEDKPKPSLSKNKPVESSAPPKPTKQKLKKTRSRPKPQPSTSETCYSTCSEAEASDTSQSSKRTRQTSSSSEDTIKEHTHSRSPKKTTKKTEIPPKKTIVSWSSNTNLQK